LDKILLLEEQTRNIILDLYISCEKYFIQALIIFENIYESKDYTVSELRKENLMKIQEETVTPNYKNTLIIPPFSPDMSSQLFSDKSSSPTSINETFAPQMFPQPLSTAPPPESQLVEQSPLEQSPVEQSPVQETVEQSSVQQSPVEQSPVQETVEQLQPEQSPIQEPVEQLQPVEQSSLQETVEQSPIQYTVEQSPIQYTVEQSPIQEKVEQLPVQETVEQLPVEQSPVQETVEQLPVEQSPVQETVEQSPVQERVQQSNFKPQSNNVSKQELIKTEPLYNSQIQKKEDSLQFPINKSQNDKTIQSVNIKPNNQNKMTLQSQNQRQNSIKNILNSNSINSKPKNISFPGKSNTFIEPPKPVFNTK
jgi:hypothetical protein